MEKIVFSISFKSSGKYSIYSDLSLLSKHTFAEFKPDPEWVSITQKELLDMGFDLEAESEVGLSFSCGMDLFNDIFNASLIKKKVRGISNIDYFYYESESEIEIPTNMNYISRIILPKQLFVLDDLIENENAPSLNYPHYRLPDDVRGLSKIEKLEELYEDVKTPNVVMIDTGLYKHKYFYNKYNDITVLPAVSFFDPAKDERGHGTGMAAILLSIESKCKLTVIKASNLNYSYPLVAMQKANMLNPDVISCSWGVIGYEPHLYLEVANALSKNIVVVFSAGNGSCDRARSIFQTIAYPEVITVGGCLPHEDGSFEISDISSSYESNIFEGRRVPDLCGLCGKLPFAQIVLMPTQSASYFDKENSKRDGTLQNDGWFVSSGTSAAAAYVSGIISTAIRKGIFKKENIMLEIFNCCKPVTKGKSFMGDLADSEFKNHASGYGFLDAEGILNRIRNS